MAVVVEFVIREKPRCPLLFQALRLGWLGDILSTRCCWGKTLCCQMLLSGGGKKKKTTFAFIFRCPNKSSPPSSHCNKNITIIKHLCQPKSIPKSLAPVGRPAANKALNLRETFLQLLIKYNTAKFHLQHIILIMGMEIIHSIAIQK